MSVLKRLGRFFFGDRIEHVPWIAPPSPPPYEPPTAPKPLDYTFVPPEESSIGAPDPNEGDYGWMRDQLIDGEVIAGDDAFAADLLYYGWYASDDQITDRYPKDDPRDVRATMRDTFFDYTGMADYDYDWDAWRDWYSEVG